MATRTNAPKRKPGRPSSFTQELADKICEMIADGKSEREICRMEGMPTAVTLRKWKDANPEFLVQSARARQESADLYDDQRRAICDELTTLARNAAEEGVPIPKGVVEAMRASMQELARSAAIRDDSRYGDRKTVKVEPGAGAGEGLKAFYDQWMKDERESVS